MPTYVQNTATTVPDGEYAFTVTDAKETTAKSGKTMIQLQLQVEDPETGDPVTIFDNLIFAPRCYFHIDDFRESIGEKLGEGECNVEADELLGRTGWCATHIEEFEGKESTKVKRYLAAKAERPF